MMSKEEISEFKRAHHSLEKRMEQIGKKQCSAIVRLSEPLQELIDNIESTREREKSLWNPDISTKIKVVKKGARLFKKLAYFEGDVVKEFKNGNISEDIGRRFMLATSLVKDSKIPLAKKEFEYFRKIVELSKTHEKSRDEMEKKDRMLKKEQHRIKNLLTELSGLEKQTINLEKARRYAELLKNLEKLEKIREAYLSSLTSEPIAPLLEDADTMRDYFPGFPGKEEISRIRIFFSEYPTLGKYKVSQICELFNFSEKRISHICPETSRFKKIILANKNLFETLHSLKQSNFLAVDDENEKVMDFFAEKVEGAQEVVEQIRLLRTEKLSCMHEYEKMKNFEERKKELSKYSKENLQKELEEIESLLEFLHSVPEEKEEKNGLLSKLSSFFKIGRYT